MLASYSSGCAKTQMTALYPGKDDSRGVDLHCENLNDSYFFACSLALIWGLSEEC